VAPDLAALCVVLRCVPVRTCLYSVNAPLSFYSRRVRLLSCTVSFLLRSCDSVYFDSNNPAPVVIKILTLILCRILFDVIVSDICASGVLLSTNSTVAVGALRAEQITVRERHFQRILLRHVVGRGRKELFLYFGFERSEQAWF